MQKETQTDEKKEEIVLLENAPTIILPSNLIRIAHKFLEDVYHINEEVYVEFDFETSFVSVYNKNHKFIVGQTW